uniref:Mitochondrial import inner membrane translocase subunit Tim21 n=1 Tax=Strongyloides venezuelensis TaxID=75913 RepID=A0A0K0FVF3_STRVS
MLRILPRRRLNILYSHYFKNSIRSISNSNHFLKEEIKDTKDKVTSFSNKEDTAISKSVLEDIYTYHEEKPKTFTGKAKQATVNTFFYSCLAASVAALGALVYVLFTEIFGPSSPSVIFSKSLSVVREDPNVKSVFGDSVAGYGEENRRGRRRNYIHSNYEKDGEQRVLVQYNIKGNDVKGRVTVVMGNKDGSWDYRILTVETTTRPYRTFTIIDNRNLQTI